MKEKEIRVLKVEPHKNPEEITLENVLKAMQEAVGGLIEFVSIDSEKGIKILCNEEGKLIGLEPNRRLGNDIIVGTFFVVKSNTQGECVSLSQEEADKYKNRFWIPDDTITQEEIEETLIFNIEINKEV